MAGLALSRLAPYTSWNDVYAEYARQWDRYVEIIKPDQLDITVSMALQSPKENLHLESKMNMLRSRKNELFEACMKTQACDLIRETSK